MSENRLGEKQNVRPYVLVFVALMALTVITVAVSYLDLSVGAAVALALAIALIKGSLVACYFMHLLSENKLVLLTLAITVVLFFAVLLGPKLTALNPIEL